MSVEQPIIPGGYILLSRRILGSAIWSKPPLYLKIWVYLLTQAQHQEFKGLKRGQLWTSIPEIQEAMAYKVGFRTEKPTKKQVWGVLEWLRSPTEASPTRFPDEGTATVTMTEPMIVTTKVTHGLLVNIVNYDFYQDSKNYERNVERNDEGTTKERRGERQGNNIYKNDKNEKKIEDHLSKTDVFDYQALVDMYHNLCPSLSKVTKLNANRKSLLKARHRDHGLDGLNTLFAKAEASDFLSGRTSRWKATFDWLLKDSNCLKVLEGNYDLNDTPPDKQSKKPMEFY